MPKLVFKGAGADGAPGFGEKAINSELFLTQEELDAIEVICKHHTSGKKFQAIAASSFRNSLTRFSITQDIAVQHQKMN